GERQVRVQGRHHVVGPEGQLAGAEVGEGSDAAGVDALQSRHIFQDLGQVAGDAGQLLSAEVQTSQLGDVFDLLFSDAHGTRSLAGTRVETGSFACAGLS